jgi:uncharacterized iron-regulated membrane protein
MNFDLFFRKLHLYLALLALVPLVIIAVTGLLLLFEAEITQWQAEEHQQNDAQLVMTPQVLTMLHLHTEQLLVENSQCKLNYIRHDVQAESLSWVYLSCPEKRKKFVVNLNTNQHCPLQKDGFQLILDLHRTLLLGEVGQNIVGISTLVIIFNIVLGLVLWFIHRFDFSAGYLFMVEADAMIFLVTLLQLIWLSLSSAFLIFWLRRAVGLLLTNGIIFLVFNVA